MRKPEERELIMSYGGEEQDFGFYHKLSDPPREVPLHLHSCYEIYFLVSGQILYVVEDRAYRIQPGDVVVVNCKESHAPMLVTNNEPIERYVVHFRPQFIGGFTSADYNILGFLRKRRVGLDNIYRASDYDTTSLLAHLKQLEAAIVQRGPEMTVMIQALFVQFLVGINRMADNSRVEADPVIRNGRYDEKIVAILLYIHEHLEKQITLDALATEFAVSKYHLCRIFKASTGLTVGEYIDHQRIARVVGFLRQGVPALEAAYAAGFNQYSTCYKVFRRVTGVSPSKVLGFNHAERA
jgi:AraC-like DNA-binding protein/mannose-6-phosphate isomerase-like protein (cupin superfamily)